MKPPAFEFISIGEILAPSGTKGKLKVRVETDFPQRFTPGAKVYIDQQPMTIDHEEWHKGKLTIKLSTVDSFEDAKKLQGKSVEIHLSQVYRLPEGEYYYFQLIGLEVWTAQGELLGNITDILPAESNDNYVVGSTKGEILIPAIEDVVKSIDLDRGRITIEPLEGLLSLNRKAAE